MLIATTSRPMIAIAELIAAVRLHVLLLARVLDHRPDRVAVRGQPILEHRGRPMIAP
jgi:hypothetical protein